MDSVASTVIYLASSLTAAPGADVPPAIHPATVIVAPIARDVSIPAPRIESDPFAEARARGRKSLNEVIADEVRRDARDDVMVETGMDAPDAETHDTVDDDGDVTAAHDARIEVIKRRMDEVRLGGPPGAATLADLDTKLRMAVAARCLAVARQASARLRADPEGASDAVGAHACLPAGRAIAATTPPRSRRGHDRLPTHHRPAPDRAMASLSPAPSGAAAGRRSPMPTAAGGGHAVRSHRAPGRSRDAATVLASAPPIAHGRPDTSPTSHHRDASGHIRELLAKARRLLEDDHAPHAEIRLAGLIHWQGSDTWSLADYTT